MSTDDETSDDDAPWVKESSDGGDDAPGVEELSDAGEAEVQEALQVSQAEEEGIGGVSAGSTEFLDDI